MKRGFALSPSQARTYSQIRLRSSPGSDKRRQDVDAAYAYFSLEVEVAEDLTSRHREDDLAVSGAAVCTCAWAVTLKVPEGSLDRKVGNNAHEPDIATEGVDVLH